MKLFKLLMIAVTICSYSYAAEQNSGADWMGDLDKVIKQSNNKAYWLSKSSPNKSSALTAELKEGQRVAMTVCGGCHGVDGIATGAGNSVIVPNIIAQNKSYLTARLKAYKSGAIKHEQMSMIAKMISEKDIDNVAAWYSSLQVIVADPKLPEKAY
jgi:cytochrome c553